MAHRTGCSVLSLIFAASICAGPAFAQTPAIAPHPSTQDPANVVTLDDIARWESELSNWGRWGPDDQRGTLNPITPEKTRAAA